MSNQVERWKLVVVSGPEGASVYLNNSRIAGPKPWGGGKTLHEFSVKESDLRQAIKQVNSAEGK